MPVMGFLQKIFVTLYHTNLSSYMSQVDLVIDRVMVDTGQKQVGL